MAKEHNYYPCGLLCCFPSDPLKIIVKVPVGGYVSGQTIKLTLTADNESNRRIPSFKTELIKVQMIFKTDCLLSMLTLIIAEYYILCRE